MNGNLCNGNFLRGLKQWRAIEAFCFIILFKLSPFTIDHSQFNTSPVLQIILETPRLILRQFTEADAPLILLLISDPEVIKYLHEPLLKSEDEAREIIRKIILPQYKNSLGRWAVHTKANNEFIGWCGLKYLEESGEIDLGYRFLPTAWGKGYATESAKHVLDHGFNQLHLQEIMGKAHIQNIGSINVLQKTGMRFIKDIIEHDSLVKVFHAVNPLV